MSSLEQPVAEALESFRVRADSARAELARAAYAPAGRGLSLGGLVAISRLEGYLEGYLEALKLAPPAVVAECVPEAHSLLRDLTAILVTAD